MTSLVHISFGYGNHEADVAYVKSGETVENGNLHPRFRSCTYSPEWVLLRNLGISFSTDGATWKSMTALRIFNRSEIREEGHAKEDFTDGAFREAGVRVFDEKLSMLRHFHTIATMAIFASMLSV